VLVIGEATDDKVKIRIIHAGVGAVNESTCSGLGVERDRHRQRPADRTPRTSPPASASIRYIRSSATSTVKKR
jgi:hypothetical protein